jgi:hypothetical protein
MHFEEVRLRFEFRSHEPLAPEPGRPSHQEPFPLEHVLRGVNRAPRLPGADQHVEVPAHAIRVPLDPMSHGVRNAVVVPPPRHGLEECDLIHGLRHGSDRRR